MGERRSYPVKKRAFVFVPFLALAVLAQGRDCLCAVFTCECAAALGPSEAPCGGCSEAPTPPLPQDCCCFAAGTCDLSVEDPPAFTQRPSIETVREAAWASVPALPRSSPEPRSQGPPDDPHHSLYLVLRVLRL